MAELNSGTTINTPHHRSEPEAEMQLRPGSYPMPRLSSSSSELLEPLLTQAFISQPILGNIVLSPEQRDKVHTMAVTALFNALEKTGHRDYGLGDFYCDILVLETVLLLRDWSGGDSESSDDKGDANFWEYICNQYALLYDEGFGNGHAYKIFRYAIKRSLGRHKRLLLKTGQKYYTTMLTHALAPRAKFYALFDQIFSLYAKTLNSHYMNADPAFRAFSYAMKIRFQDGRSAAEDNVYIKSVQSSSAIKALFSQTPEYMGTFVEYVVSRIDALVATGSMQQDEASYLDMLLSDWYGRRSREERAAARQVRANAGTERVVTEFSNIRATYRYEAGTVSLTLPPIRLGKKAESLPWITVYRYPGDETPYSRRLDYYGDSFCITSSKATIPIDQIIRMESKRIEPQMVIAHGKNEVYDSGTKLCRDAIVFGNDGGEVTKRPSGGYVNIFVTRDGEVEGENTSSDCTAEVCGNGFLYRVFINDETHISVNKTNLLPMEQAVSGLTLGMSVAPMSHCRYWIDQQECAIFTEQTTFTISSENPSVEKQYRIMLDDEPHALAEYYDASTQSYRIALPATHGVHALRIIENATQQRKYTLSYVMLEAFSLRFNGFYYDEKFGENGNLELSDERGSTLYPYEVSPGQDAMLIPYGAGDLAVEIPMLRCRLDGERLPADVQRTLWYEDIPMSALLEAEAPRGYSSTIMLGQRFFASAEVELGNAVRASYDAAIETVGILLRRDDEPPIQIKLFDVAFEAFFRTKPVLAEAASLLWCIEDNYIGNMQSEFELRIFLDDDALGRYQVGCEDEAIALDNPLANGRYTYTVSKKAPGFFAKFEVFSEGDFIVGNPALFRFDNQAVLVTEAILDGERIALKESSGIITALRYMGEQPLNGEAQPYPCYEGVLQFKHDGTLRPYANRAYELSGIHREQVNPVKLWFINEYTISLRSPMDDGLYVNKKWASITDREPTGWTKDYCNPDYYSFKRIKHSEVDNV
jgi:hypothetical protein